MQVDEHSELSGRQLLSIAQTGGIVNCANQGADTELFLVRIWKRRPGEGAHKVRGKLQHVVTGAVDYFDGLSSLPEVLGKMIEQERPTLNPDTQGHTDEDTQEHFAQGEPKNE